MPCAAKAICFAAGIQALILAGVHRDIAGGQNGVAGGALLQFNVRAHRWQLRVEGIPPVALPQRSSAKYGQATPQVSLLSGALLVAVDPAEHLWLGVGETIINQRTPLPNLSQVVASRLAGMRYEAAYRAPLRGGHFLQFMAGGAPQLTGIDHFIYSDGQPPVDKPEIASELDAMAAFGLQRRDDEFLFGIRTINFSAKFLNDGSAADRNNGAGLLFEYRRFLGR
jgi:hypothetical protein